MRCERGALESMGWLFSTLGSSKRFNSDGKGNRYTYTQGCQGSGALVDRPRVSLNANFGSASCVVGRPSYV